MNSLNSLLKIIEEPTKNNFFFLINNKYKPILQTIKSRALDIKIILKNNTRLSIIKDLVNSFNLNLKLDPDSTFLTPGDFVKFNHICNEYDIILTNDYLENLSLLLNLYKKNKDILFINLALFIADFYLGNLKKNKVLDNNKKGLGGAINLGIKKATGENIAIMMADQSDDINDLIEYNNLMR